MGINIQVHNAEDFTKLREIADYSSELTKVISLTDQQIMAANAKYPGLLQKYEVKEAKKETIKAVAKYVNGKIIMENATADLLLFLQVYSSMNPQVKTGAFDRFFIALEKGFIELDKSLSDSLTPLNYKATISDLLASSGRIRFRGRLWSLNTLGKDSLVQKTLLFHEARVIKTRMLPLNNITITSHDIEAGTTQLFDSVKNRKYTGKFYSRSPLLKQVLKPGRILNLVVSRVYGNETNGYTLNAPIIVPEGLDLKEFVTLKSPRTIPTSFYNAAWYEYKYRQKLKK